MTDNRLVYRDGIPVATLSAGKVEFLVTLDAKDRWEAEKRLVRSAARGLLSAGWHEIDPSDEIRETAPRFLRGPPAASRDALQLAAAFAAAETAAAVSRNSDA